MRSSAAAFFAYLISFDKHKKILRLLLLWKYPFSYIIYTHEGSFCMSMKYKKELSYVCLGISITAMLLYFYLTIENYLNFSGIVMFSVLICSTLILGVCLQNRLYDTQKQTRNLRLMWIVLFSFYIFQMIYILFFASEFARDYVDLRSQSYPDSLWMQWEYGTSLKPFATIHQMMAIFDMPYVDNRIAVMNLLGNFVAFMPFSFFLLLLTDWAKRPVKLLLRMAFIIIMVEILQFFTLSGTMDIDDFILNFSGVLLSYIILRFTPLYKSLSVFLKK